MQTLTLPQGSPEWHAHRAQALNASDVPAMLGISPYKTRADFLRERAAGIITDVSPEQQRIFDRGHAIEALARPLAEAILGEDLSPCVGTDGTYSASLDGITFDGQVVWECKTLNASLREALPYEICDEGYGYRLPDHYRAQLEQQAMVSGCARILFSAASLDESGELSEIRHCWYRPDPAMQARIVNGWDQFKKDLAAYVPTEAAAPVVATPIESLPAVVVQVQGALTVAGNLPAFGDALRAFIDRIPQRPETDQQFADADAACKALKKAEDALAQAEDGALAQISDVESMRRAVADLKTLARSTRLATEKLVKAEKDNRRTEKIMAARQAFDKHVSACQLDIKGVRLNVAMPDFGGAIKGLSSLASIDEKLTAALLAAKAEVNTLASRIIENLHMIDSVPDYSFLFSDRSELAYKDSETLELIITLRVKEHQQQEAARMEAERERIRQEEERKAREAAEREAKAEAARIEQEEAAKAQPVAPLACNPCTDTGKTLTLSLINDRLTPIRLDAAGLAALGFEPVARDKAAKLYRASEFPAMCQAIANVAMAAAQMPEGEGA